MPGIIVGQKRWYITLIKNFRRKYTNFTMSLRQRHLSLRLHAHSSHYGFGSILVNNITMHVLQPISNRSVRVPFHATNPILISHYLAIRIPFSWMVDLFSMRIGCFGLRRSESSTVDRIVVGMREYRFGSLIFSITLPSVRGWERFDTSCQWPSALRCLA